MAWQKSQCQYDGRRQFKKSYYHYSIRGLRTTRRSFAIPLAAHVFVVFVVRLQYVTFPIAVYEKQGRGYLSMYSYLLQTNHLLFVVLVGA